MQTFIFSDERGVRVHTPIRICFPTRRDFVFVRMFVAGERRKDCSLTETKGKVDRKTADRNFAV
jgi:hypothetical protein